MSGDSDFKRNILSCNDTFKVPFSLRSRRLEEVGERENGRARGRQAIFGCLPGKRSLSPRVPPSRAPVFSCPHYFQAPATQAKCHSSRCKEG